MRNKIPFDLERAKAGDPVETRGGNKVRILCFDRKGNYPIVALIDDDDSEAEEIESFTLEGTHALGCVTNFDLVMAPKVIVKYVIVYSDGSISSPIDTYDEAHELIKFYDLMPGEAAIGKVEYEL